VCCYLLASARRSSAIPDDSAVNDRFLGSNVEEQSVGPLIELERGRILQLRGRYGYPSKCRSARGHGCSRLIRKDEGQTGAGGRRADDAADGLAGVGSGAVTSMRWMP